MRSNIIGSGLMGREVKTIDPWGNEKICFVAQADYNKGITIKDLETGIDVICFNKDKHHLIPHEGTWHEHWEWARQCIIEKGIMSAQEENKIFKLKKNASSTSLRRGTISCAF